MAVAAAARCGAPTRARRSRPRELRRQRLDPPPPNSGAATACGSAIPDLGSGRRWRWELAATVVLGSGGATLGRAGSTAVGNGYGCGDGDIGDCGLLADPAASPPSLLRLLRPQRPKVTVALIGGSLFFLQQFAGINGVLYFSSLTFHDVGITSGILASLYVGITNFAGAIVASILMDKQGRKKLLTGSYLGMALAMFLIVYAISFPLDEGVSHGLSITGTLLYIFTFAIGAGPVTGIIIPELSGARTRSKVMGFSFTVHWICNFLVGLYFLELVKKLGVGAVYAGFGGVSFLSALFAYNFIVETKGRSLEEIEMSLSPAAPGKRE
ncbi:hypothetical protein OsJ_29594 [Oryza sativa Japonica Group]|uniref:Major facilitator superfamily (MFS) profile domain-containing protein n=2 Tax=Oryza TaxID=4527 RepID=B9G3Y5_ORYSJ|nr:hypothetical protein OsJ_29594 [Oryza sativa Japonica Group]